jgi:membrane-associated protease RseP (regulator of RpoE activity)
MKKPALIVAVILGVLIVAITFAVSVDVIQRKSKPGSAPTPAAQTTPPAPRAVAPPAAPPAQLPLAQLQNLQAPVEPPLELRVAALIRGLANPDINASIQAEKELLLIGKPAVASLQNAADSHPNQQVRATCKRLIAQINSGSGLPIPPSGDNGAGALQGMPENAGGAMGDNAAQAQALQQMLGALGGAQPNAAGRRHIQLNGNDLMRRERLLGGLRVVGAPRRPDFNVPSPQPAAVGELSTNLLDSFGARLSEAADGLRVLDVKPGTAAAVAGLKVGDLVTHLNGQQVAKAEELKEIYDNLAAGDKLDIEVSRRGDAVRLSARK